VSARRTAPPSAPPAAAKAKHKAQPVAVAKPNKNAEKRAVSKGVNKAKKPALPPKAAQGPREARVEAREQAPVRVDARSAPPEASAPVQLTSAALRPSHVPELAPAAGRAAHAQSSHAPEASPPARPSREDGDVYSAFEAESGPLSGLSELSGFADSDVASEEASRGARLLLGSGAERRAQEAFAKGSQSLLSSDYYVRQYGAHGLRNLSAEVDEYGLDPHVEERARPWLEMLSTRYFRLDLEGAERVPDKGRALLVCNRSGSVPWDGLMLRTALRMQRPELQPLRWLSEDSVIHYPFLGTFMNRLGAVRACPENAERMLTQDRLVAVFPEGAQGSQKLFKDRYRLQRFGRGGYVKLALKLGAPILPTAIIGAEEVNPLLARLSLFGRSQRGEGGDFLPITPTFPWLGPLGLLPAPVKWRVIVGDPVDLSAYGPDAAEDALVVHRLNEQIRGILQTLIDQAQGSRRSVLFG
jgi:1-acyl-sn-glycerol-3-phosphate acyltransferase